MIPLNCTKFSGMANSRTKFIGYADCLKKSNHVMLPTVQELFAGSELLNYAFTQSSSAVECRRFLQHKQVWLLHCLWARLLFVLN